MMVALVFAESADGEELNNDRKQDSPV
jgi:hypothetical protein